MKILFAAPDRDLLECYQRIWEADFGETVTAFDGLQVLSLLSAETFDAAVLDEGLPRIEPGVLIARMRKKGIPVAVLTDGPLSARKLTGEPSANAWLSYPFSVGQIGRVIRDMREKAASSERFTVAGCEIDVPGFRIVGGPSLTAGEIDVLRSLRNGKAVTADSGAYIDALNVRFASAGAAAGIRYRAGKGFELVTGHE